MGVFAPDLGPFLAGVFSDLGAKSALVVSGYGGLDELTTTGPNQVSHYCDGTIETYELDPERYGFRGAHISELLGGDAPQNAAILRGVLGGEVRDAKRDVVLLNGGAALLASGVVEDLREGIGRARTSIDEGHALEKLRLLVSYSHRLAA